MTEVVTAAFDQGQVPTISCLNRATRPLEHPSPGEAGTLPN
jgi:hypothetical protein